MAGSDQGFGGCKDGCAWGADRNPKRNDGFVLAILTRTESLHRIRNIVGRGPSRRKIRPADHGCPRRQDAEGEMLSGAAGDAGQEVLQDHGHGKPGRERSPENQKDGPAPGGNSAEELRIQRRRRVSVFGE